MERTYRIVIEKRVERVLRRLPQPARQRIERAIAGLANDPRPPGCRKLVGAGEAWRIRVSDYRIVYRIRDALLTVLVVRIGHRRDVYE
jgi:mRNA interferase RelE/StbE